ncbi:MAG TPA: YqfO family protein [Candidatus Paceibacterota bacterium]
MIDTEKRYKIVVYVPSSHADALRAAMGDAGAGRIGDYTHCMFTLTGIGQFKPGEGADPYVGEVGKLNSVEEERIETVCEGGALEAVVRAIRETHPYEEPAFDVYPIALIA